MIHTAQASDFSRILVTASRQADHNDVIGRAFTRYPWHDGYFLGSGPGDVCLEQAGMHGEAQWEIIRRFVAGGRPAQLRSA